MTILFSKLDPRRPIHLAGIGGSAMQGLAQILQQRGFLLVGTDPRDIQIQGRPALPPISVYREQDGRHLHPHTQLVIASAALGPDHPELAAARNRGIKIVKYAHALGALMSLSEGVAVAGTHGKSTTTAMLVFALQQCGIGVDFILGGQVPQLRLPPPVVDPSPPFFVAEACEYDRSFLQLSPKHAIITNIDADHLDVYKDLDEIIATFNQFAQKIPHDGTVIYHRQCRHTATFAPKLNCQTLSFGSHPAADLAATNIAIRPDGTTFELILHQKFAQSVYLSQPGHYNILNALAVLAMGHALGLPIREVASALGRFTGVTRRFEILGEVADITFVDDYAHHPTEIDALLAATHDRFPNRRVVVVFQPHQISRTAAMCDAFAQSLANADQILVTDIYAAREQKTPAADTLCQSLVQKINGQGGRAVFTGAKDKTMTTGCTQLHAGDVLLTIGAGDVDTIGKTLFRHFSHPAAKGPTAAANDRDSSSTKTA